MKRWVLAIVLSFLAAPAAQAASFDCLAATTEIEKSICRDPELGGLDESLDRVYQRNLLRLADPGEQRAAQRKWLREVRDQCHSVA